jgi:nucleotide sugar dehydrogenase
MKMKNVAGVNFRNRALPVVCIQGLGFVGAAMAAAVARARDSHGSPFYNVMGIDLGTPEGLERIEGINQGRFPMPSVDSMLLNAVREGHEAGNLKASTDSAWYSRAKIVVVNLPLDISDIHGSPSIGMEPFRRAIQLLGEQMQRGSLVIVETTVPPGTCEKVVVPVLDDALRKRGLPPDSIHVAHSYERVMPGSDHLNSIVNFWRVYAGTTVAAAEMCEEFLSTIINTRDFPLTRLQGTTASEIGKVLENSYRAVTIAFMEEWGRFAESVNVDLFEVIDAIRLRPTHSNMRQPGFGVGGYCLTKDPLFAYLSAKQLFDMGSLDFPFCNLAIEVNRRMPLVSLDQVERLLGGSLKGKRILLLGISYRQDVGDTRSSPSEVFVAEAIKREAEVLAHDPLVQQWSETQARVVRGMPDPDVDAVVFAVPHQEYRRWDLERWLGSRRPVIFDANRVLTRSQLESLSRLGCRVGSIGRGVSNA